MSDAVDAIQEQIDIQWSTNWSELPPEAEQEVEKAFEHLTRARDLAETDNAGVADRE